MSIPAAAADHRTSPEAVDAAVDLLAGTGFVALTGAGMSTDSGIPDYRGPTSLNRAPMTFQEFMSGPHAQRRYWARAFLGWSRMGFAEPNPGHVALARLQREGVCTGLVTQNVDGLHERAGSPTVALHGRVSEVVCLGCRAVTDRASLQDELARLNPGWLERHAEVPARPDGDADLEETVGFVVPACEVCGGVLKPHVVFFGENVPRDRVEQCFAMVEAADALLVLGSSLAVMSGLRFVRRAAELDLPVVIVNQGTTRGDDLATLALHHGTTEFLTHPHWESAQEPDVPSAPV